MHGIDNSFSDNIKFSLSLLKNFNQVQYFLSFLCFGSHVAQVSLEFTILSRVTLNIDLLCLPPKCCGIIFVYIVNVSLKLV